MSWHRIPGFTHYYVNEAGEVLGKSGKILSPYENKHGDLVVTLYEIGIISERPVHNLVARAFLGACSRHKKVAHKNGDRTDCRPENLEYTDKIRRRD